MAQQGAWWTAARRAAEAFDAKTALFDDHRSFQIAYIYFPAAPVAQVLQSFTPVAPLQYGGCLAQGDTDPHADRVHVRLHFP